MSETSKGGGAFAKVVQKTLVRTKTKVLQRVGKAEKTTDDVFKTSIEAFQRQHATALKLQREMKHYITCVKAMAASAKSLYAVLRETYEEDWYDPHAVQSNINSLEMMQTNYEAELSERVFTDLNSYVDQFPIYKEKMNKRRRKLLDYDNAKHAYESLYSAKKPDHTKISKAQESMEESKHLFEDINNELHRELPKFYEYRVEFVANNLIKLFTAESTLHSNTGQLNDKLIEMLETLAKTHAEEMDRLRDEQIQMGHKPNTSHLHEDPEALDLSSLSAGPVSPIKSNGNGDVVSPQLKQQTRNSQVKIVDHGHAVKDETPRSDSKPSTSSTTTSQVLYQVMATHPYEAEDDDELSFEAGEIIDVVEFDDEEEQDDGWLMGINPKTQHKGVFPANFTQKISRKT